MSCYSINKGVIVALLAVILFFPFGAFAYDKTGHRIVAQIANYNLKPKVRHKIENLLGKNGLVNNANWADEIKSNRAFDYALKWHYFNVDADYNSTQLDSLFQQARSQSGNIFSAIDSLANALRKNKNDTNALRFLIHFMGDLHQPLHSGKSTDFGGHLVKLKWFKDSTDLHVLWDTHLVDFEQLSYSEYSKYLFELNQFKEERQPGTDLLTSFKKAYTISRELYKYDYTNLNPYQYYYTFSQDLKRMLTRGGYQLAALLNEIYSK